MLQRVGLKFEKCFRTVVQGIASKENKQYTDGIL